MTLMTSAALMYRPERVQFYCIAASGPQLAEVASLRTGENEKWITFYESQSARERARLNLLKQTGSLLSALR